VDDGLPFRSARTQKSLVFDLNGWHHTELPGAALMSLKACSDAQRDWLEADHLPTD
jgi:hypothetical protein